MKGLALFLTLLGCASPYKPFGSETVWGGYEEEDLGQGKYLVTYHGNNMTAPDTVRSRAYRRAGEVCDARGYDILVAEARPGAGQSKSYSLTVACK